MISVLLCTYNRESLLRETIDSILAQSYKDFEFIIVDDGSTDGTREILEEYREQDERIRLIFQEKNKFYCRSANDGLKHVRGEYVAFATSDDTWHSEKLQKQMAYLEQHPECGACFTFADIIDENGKPAEKDFSNTAEIVNKHFDTLEERFRYFFRYGNCVLHPSAILPRWMMEKIGGYHLLLCQGADLEMWIRVARYGDIYVLPEKLISYRCHHNPENQISGASRLKTARFLNEQMLMRKKIMQMLSDEELVRFFGPCFKKKDASTHLELEIERAFLLAECVNGLPDMYVLGIEKFEEILDKYKEEAVEVLENEYRTTLQDLYAMNLHHFYVDFGIHEKMAEYEQKLKQAEERALREKEEIVTEWNAALNEKIELVKEKNQLLKSIKELEQAVKDAQRAEEEKERLEERMRAQEEENHRLRKILEQQVLDNIRLKELESGKRKEI